MKTPKPTKLHNVEQWYGHPDMLAINNTSRTVKVATICYGKPYALAKSIKRQEELKNNPKGTYFKIVPH